MGKPSPRSDLDINSGAKPQSSQERISPSRVSCLTTCRVRRSNHRKTLSEAVIKMLGSLVQTMNLIGALWTWGRSRKRLRQEMSWVRPRRPQLVSRWSSQRCEASSPARRLREDRSYQGGMRWRGQRDHAGGYKAVRQCGYPRSFCRQGLAIKHADIRRNTYAVKSAEAVAAVLASGLSLACQTAPL